MFFVKIFVVWFVILFFAILNGGVREKVLFLHVSKKGAYLLSGFSLCFLILFCTYVFFKWLTITSWEASFLVGFIWVATTILFEFVFGYFIQKKELSTLLEAYSLKDGNIWTIVLLVTFFAPYFILLCFY